MTIEQALADRLFTPGQFEIVTVLLSANDHWEELTATGARIASRGLPVDRDAAGASARDIRTWFAEESRPWLVEQSSPSNDESVFWAPCHWKQGKDWIPMRGVEQLAVHVSTAIRSDNNVCFASGTRGRAGRSTNMIGLVTRPTLGCAVIINNQDRLSGDVRRIGYKYDNYDSFSALFAAQISWAWVTAGRLPSGLTIRARTR